VILVGVALLVNGMKKRFRSLTAVALHTLDRQVYGAVARATYRYSAGL
jgi:hypothetical protein